MTTGGGGGLLTTGGRTGAGADCFHVGVGAGAGGLGALLGGAWLAKVFLRLATENGTFPLTLDDPEGEDSVFWLLMLIDLIPFVTDRRSCVGAAAGGGGGGGTRLATEVLFGMAAALGAGGGGGGAARFIAGATLGIIIGGGGGAFLATTGSSSFPKIKLAHAS